jgi:predicted  nucleic acid-binding Zn-ribbon protein
MKILYVSPQQDDPSLGQALATAGEDVLFSSATQLGEATRWIFNNLDVAALILDAEFGQPQCASFLKDLRTRGLSAPVIVMAPERDGWMESLKLSADDCILQKESLLTDFGGLVRQAAYRARPSAAFTMLAGHVVDIHRQLDRMDREHDLRLEAGDLRAAHAALREQLTRTETTLHERDARLAAEVANTLNVKAALDRQALEHRATCTTLQQELDSKNAAVERLGDRQRELQTTHDDLRTAHTALQEQLTRTETALHELDARLAAEVANAVNVKDTLDRQVAEHRATCATLLQELASKNATVERLGHRQRELQTTLADAINTRDGLANQLAATQSSLRAAEQQVQEQRVAAAREQTQLAQERSDYHSSINALQERVRQLETEREAQQRAFASTQSGLDRTILELEGALDTAARELVSTRAERDSLRTDLEHASQLQSQLEEIVQRVDSEFDNFPLPLFRATHAGAITHANRAFGALLGCPSAGVKRRLNLASDLFESSKELGWLTERCASSEEGASVECTRRKVDDSRLILRLRAMAAADAVHIVIEDLTPNWMLQEKLNRTQQMEAVGRMAAEVALTCVGFLQEANQHGRRLIAMLDEASDARRSSELMIGEVDRVAVSLRQLARYADDQAMSLEPVDLHQVLRDLEPILQELAGDDVEVVLPEQMDRDDPPFNVDLTAQRVERLLINLARYSRGRIASGGRMVFEIASTAVDGQFVPNNPSVRRGPHVLLTVTQDGAEGSPEGGNGHGPAVSPATGGDLSALHGLVRHCGGHLWMDTETTGETKIKIHLPLRAA